MKIYLAVAALAALAASFTPAAEAAGPLDPHGGGSPPRACFASGPSQLMLLAAGLLAMSLLMRRSNR